MARCASTRASSPTTCATSPSPTRLAIGSAFLPQDPVWIRWIAAAALIGIYAWYVRGHLRADAAEETEELAPLRFRRVDVRAHRNDPAVPRLRAINLQVLVALGFIIVGAVFFVDAVEHLATSLGVSEVLLALVIAPVATELPEKFNSIIWVRQNKDTLAMGNITGAMVFQSCIPTVVGLVLASEAWSDPGGVVHGVRLRRDRLRLHRRRSSCRWCGGAGCTAGTCSIGGVFYLAYLALVVVVVSGGARA